jgi:hypothetical protein
MKPISQQSHGSHSTFAKLMSTENLSVIFDSKAKTASMDVKSRVLTVPDWSDMTQEAYDLFLSHEVSHALHTPPEGMEQFIDSVVGKTASNDDKSRAAMYLNIVEDARIERLIKEKYAGLRSDYYKGYKWLADNQMFGDLSKADYTKMRIIDRTNLHFKIGKHLGTQIPFSAEEQAIIDDVEAAQTFEEVCAVTRRLWDEAKKEANQEPEQSDRPRKPTKGGDGEDGEYETNGDGDPKSTSGEQSEQRHNIAPESFTANAQKKWLDNKVKDNYYSDKDSPAYLPEYDLNRIIVPYVDIMNAMESYSSNSKSKGMKDAKDEIMGLYNEFTKEANATVDAMVKVFLTKKAAQQHHRNQTAKTGVLDMNLLTQYKWSEDIFKHFTIKPDGKNHGFIVFLDWSGSMQPLVQDVVKQMYILTSFFRRIGVPYEVYAFSTNTPVLTGNYDTDDNKSYRDYTEAAEELSKNMFSIQDIQSNYGQTGVITAQEFHLYNFASSKMRKTEHMNAMRHLFLLGSVLGGMGYKFGGNCPNTPWCLRLSDTPLDDAIIAANQILIDFRKKNKIEILNCVVISDGSTSGSPLSRSYYNDESDVGVRRPTRIVNKRTKASYSLHERMTTNVCVEYLRDNTGCNAILLFLDASTSVKGIRIPCHNIAMVGKNNKIIELGNAYNQDTTEFTAQWNNENYLLAVCSDGRGMYYNSEGMASPSDKGQQSFDKVFIIKCSNKVEVDTYESINMENATYAKLKSNFIRSLHKKIVSRTLVNRLVSSMSAHI